MLGAKRYSGRGQPWLGAREAAHNTHCPTKYSLRGKQEQLKTAGDASRVLGGLWRFQLRTDGGDYKVYGETSAFSPRCYIFLNLVRE